MRVCPGSLPDKPDTSSPSTASGSIRAFFAQFFSALPTDRNSRRAAIALGLALPTDTLLYLLLPMSAAVFGVSLPEAGFLLAANRLVRIGGYGWIVRFYDKHGDRPTCTAAIVGATICGVGYATLSGFWLLLPLRLIWGMVFGALNLSAQVLSTAEVEGSGRRAGASRGWIALVPTIALPLGALMTHVVGIRLVFAATAVIAVAGLLVTRKLPSARQKVVAPPGRRLKMPDSLDIWSFVEGFTLDGLFIIGLSYLAVDMVPSGAVVAAAVLMALRYLCEIVLSPIGGRMSERYGAEPMLIFLSIVTAVALVCFGAGWLLAGAGAIVVLRALQLPLIAPIVAARNPGPDRVRALTARSLWRDIGAGTGPLVAGFVLPIASSLLIYSIAAAMLGASAWACRSKAAASTA